jgi:hypothetical protein
MQTISQEQDNQALALLTLALNKTELLKPEDCPDEYDIAYFYDGNMTDSEYKSFMDDLMACPESYELWATVGESLNQTIKEKVQESVPSKNLLQWPKWIFTGAMTAFSTVMLATFILHTNQDSIPSIAETYDIDYTNSKSIIRQPSSIVNHNISSVATGINYDEAIVMRGGASRKSSSSSPDSSVLASFRMAILVTTNTHKDKKKPIHCINTLTKCTGMASLYRHNGACSVAMNTTCQKDSKESFESKKLAYVLWRKKWRSTLKSEPRKTGLDLYLEQLYTLFKQEKPNKNKICAITRKLVDL